MPDGDLNQHLTIETPATSRPSRKRRPPHWPDKPDDTDQTLLAALKATTCRTPLSCRLMSVALQNIDNTAAGGGVEVDDDTVQALDDEALRLPCTRLADVVAVLGMLGLVATNLHINFEDNPDPVAEAARQAASDVRRVLDAVMPYLLSESLLSPSDIGLDDFSVAIQDAHHARNRAHIARWTAKSGAVQ